MTSATATVPVRATISTCTATAIVVADMVGVGVFTSLGFQVKDIGSGFTLLVLWIVGGVVALFFLFYIFQHFKCIDLSFALEDLKSQQAKLAQLNSELRLEIANLRDPMRIDVIARRQLGLTEPLPTQMREYEALGGMQVAAARFVRRGQQR